MTAGAPTVTVLDLPGPVGLALAAVAAGLVALLVAWVLGVLVRRFGRDGPVARDLAHRVRRPLRLTMVLAAVQAVLTSEGSGRAVAVVTRVLGLALIAAIGWLIAALSFVLEDLALRRYDVDVEDNRRARRVRTQVGLLRRLTVVVISVLAVAVMLLTFPVARAAGASVLASAGVLGIVAGLAAQTSLANVIAGLQLAFTEAIRVDDVVVVQEEWGRVEEITLTYVVLHLWDDRRLILPSTYFTTTPFQNWTRTEAAVIGEVGFELDWSVPVAEMRARLHDVLEVSDLWDGRVGVLQVTDALGSFVTIRVLVSGRDGPTVFDLRCEVREALVGWLQTEHPQALPRVRHQAVVPVEGAAPGGSPRPAPAQAQPEADDARMFTGSLQAVERSKAFLGPDSDAVPRVQPDDPPRTD